MIDGIALRHHRGCEACPISLQSTGKVQSTMARRWGTTLLFLPQRDIKQACGTFDATITLNQTFHPVR
ncbi:hypothetical protein GG804_19100 [Sphingomonas histidinilytica]|uniref:hypothetical protein n=1 Tax=Rhizorhabdus histidinilytica TaxID=439228 RepID=UPI001ADCF818|nr:hypothetical protein [Rhizorhabdus histidinilytica]MBO9378878.1 hypothetical protein [Rhizorhabdus histidinilytica]